MPSCIHCFQTLTEAATLCPHCGYEIAKHYTHPLHLPPLLLLNEHYQLGRVLGQGGFGITYIGLDTRLKRRVAIKEFLPASLSSRAPDFKVVPLPGQAETFAKGLQHFIEEARHLARFDHPNIVRVRHYFECNQTGYMVMDYIKGESPLHLLREYGGRLPLDLALQIVFPILDALAIMHAQQVFHLDISAHNILFVEKSQPILIDFGAARHLNINGEYTHTLTLMLKQGYSPPEQYHQSREYIGAWTDVYACAALLYLFLTGKLPPASIERLQDDKRVQSLHLGKQAREKQVARAILKGLNLNIEQRPADVSLFKAMLLPPTQSYVWAYVGAAILMAGLVWMMLFVPVEQATINLTPDIPSLSDSAPLAASDSATEIALITFEAPTDTTQLINNHLQQAEADYQKQVYSSAYDNYQAVLKLDKAQPQAQAGLARLALHYVNSLSEKPDQDELRALALIQFPDNPALQALVQAWQKQVQQQAQQQQIDKLLNRAETQFQALKLTTPDNDNAYQSYQAVLQLQADNVKALTGLNKIAQQYATWAASKTDIAERDVLIHKGLNVVPNHAELLSLQTQTDFAYVEQLNRDEKKQQAEQIKALLEKGQVAQTQQNWNLAQRYYQQILLREENQPQAKQGLRDISQHYLEEAQQQREQQHIAESLLSINKGLAIDAQQPQLLSLQQAIQKQLKQTVTLPPISASLPDKAEQMDDNEANVAVEAETNDTVAKPAPQIMIIPTF